MIPQPLILTLLFLCHFTTPQHLRAHPPHPTKAPLRPRQGLQISCQSGSTLCPSSLGGCCTSGAACTTNSVGVAVCNATCDADSVQCTGKFEGLCCNSGLYCDYEVTSCIPNGYGATMMGTTPAKTAAGAMADASAMEEGVITSVVEVSAASYTTVFAPEPGSISQAASTLPVPTTATTTSAPAAPSITTEIHASSYQVYVYTGTSPVPTLITVPIPADAPAASPNPQTPTEVVSETQSHYYVSTYTSTTENKYQAASTSVYPSTDTSTPPKTVMVLPTDTTGGRTTIATSQAATTTMHSAPVTITQAPITIFTMAPSAKGTAAETDSGAGRTEIAVVWLMIGVFGTWLLVLLL
ncbi:hypothetical protein ACLMJK_000018 [Lecanora helva]